MLFHSYFVDGQRIHFESFKEGNEITAGVIDMWAYIHNMAEQKRNVGSLKKLYGHTSMIVSYQKIYYIRILWNHIHILWLIYVYYIFVFIPDEQTTEMASMAHNAKELTQKFTENMNNLLFLSPYDSIKDVDLVNTPILLICLR